MHSDIAGPFPESVNNTKYIIAFVDDYSRFVVLRCLASREAVHVTIEKYIQHYGIPAILRTDNEFSSNALKELARKVGMKIERTTPYCPQQNGVAERLWGVLGDKVRAMMHWSRLPRKFWCFAYIHAATV